MCKQTVVVAEHEFVDVGAAHGRRLGRGTGHEHAAAVHEQLGEPKLKFHELRSIQRSLVIFMVLKMI